MNRWKMEYALKDNHWQLSLKYQIFNQTDQEAIGNTQPLHQERSQGHTRELMFELNAADETTNDLLANLIEALKEAPDSNFQRWVSNQVDLWSMKKLDWKQDGSGLMEEAEIYYQEAI